MSMRSEAPEAQKAFYNSKEWQRCRKEYLARVGGLCERCLSRGIVRPAKVVHHREYINVVNITDPSVLLSPDNLEALCIDCHNSEHFKNRRRFSVDEFGRVTARA